jgi:hypothetical protein
MGQDVVAGTYHVGGAFILGPGSKAVTKLGLKLPEQLIEEMVREYSPEHHMFISSSITGTGRAISWFYRSEAGRVTSTALLEEEQTDTCHLCLCLVLNTPDIQDPTDWRTLVTCRNGISPYCHDLPGCR